MKKKKKTFELTKRTISKLNDDQSSTIRGGATDTCNDTDDCLFTFHPYFCPPKERTKEINCSGLC